MVNNGNIPNGESSKKTIKTNKSNKQFLNNLTKSDTKPETKSNIKPEIKPSAIPEPKLTNTNKLEFQITDWNSYHELDEEDEEQYVIQLFGRTEDDKDVCLKVTDFKPYFYVEVPDEWQQHHVDKFIDALKNKVSWATETNSNYNYDLVKSLYDYKLVKKYKFYNFTNKRKYKFVWLLFKNHTASREFANMLARPLKIRSISQDPILFQRYESNIEPHLRFMHIQNLSSCGWVSIDKSKLSEIREYSNCDLSYQVNWKFVKPSDNDNRMAPLKIMGYDIECVSCDHNFPQANRKTDKIIQIGITMYRYGSMSCYEQHILTLNGCAPINGANVECYKTEKGLIRGFAKKIRDLRPDIKAGYNNFGFDDEYIYDRINRIDKESAKRRKTTVDKMSHRFMDDILVTMGKLNNKYIIDNEKLKKSLTYFETKNLSSSALGDNILKFFQVPGIISIDMLKVIMRDHKLSGYRLDFVSANFITEDAKKFAECEKCANTDPPDPSAPATIWIYTKSTKALEKGAYIQVMVDDGYSSTPFSEGAKYRVLDIQTLKEGDTVWQGIKTSITRASLADLDEILKNKLLKIYWTFAKDDMHHTLINKYFKEGDPLKIRKVAKYCLKDCKLVNLLLSKLEIIINSIGMAKVCHVPLSYLFLRGQGVKIFSLVSKKCREKNYLIPVLRRKQKDVDGDDDESYEGATVITPVPGVYLDPIGVLDYSSLYPNSMRERNTTQECYVNDPKYDNLPGYIYHDIYIVKKNKKGKIMRNADGTPIKEHHRFAQELVTDEMINAELKNIFDKINADTEKKIQQIMEKTHFTDKDKEDLTKEAKEKDKADRLQVVDDYEVEQTITKEEHDKKLKELETKLKKRLVEIEKLDEVTDKHREELIDKEKKGALKKISDEKTKKYNVVDGKTVRYGILPEILTELLNSRKAVNGKLAVETDPSLKPIWNSLQLAYKVTANSLYGQTGAATSPIYFVAIAASTTAIGRERLHFAKKVVEENFEGSEVIYGDSVLGDTPLIVKDEDGNIEIKTIETLGTKWKAYEEFKPEDSNRKYKQQSKTNYQVWTSNGWKQIKRVIRHKTTKKIYRILTHTGCIDVTEDHSLLDKNKKKISPKKCKIGTELLHGFPEFKNTRANISKEEAFVQGRELGINHVPIEIIHSKKSIKRAFIDGYITNDTKHKYMVKDGLNSFDTRGKVNAQGLFYLLKCLGYNVSIDTATDPDLYRLTYTYKKFQQNNIAIKKKEYLYTTSNKKRNDYVYDLETTDGTFHAGIGELIVKNTDSIFINFHVKNKDGSKCEDQVALRKTIKLARQAAKMINDRVPKPQGIVYEKTFFPFILVAKKKYVGLLYGEDPLKYYLKAMGIVLKRRDNAPIVKIVVGGIIDYILKHRDIKGAIQYTKDVLRKLMDGEYPIEKFIISKTLKAKYKRPSGIAHKVLADRMAVRDPGNKPQVNDRIPFVYVVKDFGKKKKKDILQGDLIEHPDYVIENGLKIDYLYYLEHQIINPATQILELMMSTRKVEKLFNDFVLEEQNKRIGRQNMEKWMGQKVDTSDTDNTYAILKPINPNSIEKTIIGKGHKYDKKNMEIWMPKNNTDTSKTKSTPIAKPSSKAKPISKPDTDRPHAHTIVKKWFEEKEHNDDSQESENDFSISIE